MRTFLLAATAATALGAGGAAAEQICGADIHMRYGETRAYFRDVLGACRPDGYCSVVSAIPDPSGAAAYKQQLRVARPSPGAPHQVELTAVRPLPADDPQPTALTFAGPAFDLSGDLAATDSVNTFRIQSQTTADSVVSALKAARTARWSYGGETGPAAAVFPLNGMTAALAWIDCVGARR